MKNEKKSGSKDLLLINPPSGFLLDERVFLPLGIASVASTAREQGYKVRLLDLLDKGDYSAQAAEEVVRGNFGAVGITATSPQFFYAHRILRKIKERSPNTKVIIGGAHASMFSALRDSLIKRFSSQGFSGSELEERLHQEEPNLKRLEDFDVIAHGEENSIFTALTTSDKWIDGGVSSKLDELPLPARDLFDVKSYLIDPQGTPKFTIGGKAAGSLISQRGCPYQCEFCCGRGTAMYNRPILSGGVLRAHSPERILEELDLMNQEFGLESFMFYDDEFNLNPRRTLELCAALSGRNYNFRGFVKSDLLVKHPEVAPAMKAAGFSEVLTGVESGSDRILGRHLRKKTSPSLNYQAAEILMENRIGLKALTMLGHTSETEADVLATRDWILKAGKMFEDNVGPGHFGFDLTVFQPYAGCPIWDTAEQNTGEFSDEFKWVYETRHKGELVDPEQGGLYFNKVDFSTEHGFYKGIPGEYKAFIRTKGISPERYVSLRDDIDSDIREKLGMPKLVISKASQFEHSMGQGSSEAK